MVYRSKPPWGRRGAWHVWHVWDVWRVWRVWRVWPGQGVWPGRLAWTSCARGTGTLGVWQRLARLANVWQTWITSDRASSRSAMSDVSWIGVAATGLIHRVDLSRGRVDQSP
eukprot:3160956-Prymnesium_polylepis.2